MDAKDIPFLSVLADNVDVIREEVLAFRADERLAGSSAVMEQMSTGKKLVAPETWSVLAFLTHFNDPLDFTRKYQTTFRGLTPDDIVAIYSYWRGRHFIRTQKLLEELIADERNGIISIILSTTSPGSVIKPHINNDPYMYRAHLPIIVPEGDVAIQVGDEVHPWREGEPFVFDPTTPHAAWNMGQSDRVNLFIDFLRPDEDRERMAAMELEQRERMLAKDPTSYGFSGGEYDLDDATMGWFALPEPRVSSGVTSFL